MRRQRRCPQLHGVSKALWRLRNRVSILKLKLAPWRHTLWPLLPLNLGLINNLLPNVMDFGPWSCGEPGVSQHAASGKAAPPASSAVPCAAAPVRLQEKMPCVPATVVEKPSEDLVHFSSYMYVSKGVVSRARRARCCGIDFVTPLLVSIRT